MRRVVHHAVLLPFRAQSTSYVSFPRREKKSTARERERERERERKEKERERERERKKKNWHGIDRDRWETRKKNNGAIKIGVKRNEGKKNEVKGDKIFHRK